jgi:hypothetical protein
LTAVPSYALAQTDGGHVRLELKNTSIVDSAARTFDVTSYHGALRTVATFHDGTTDTAVLEIDRAGDEQGTVVIEGPKLIWSFDLPHSRISSPIRKPDAVRTVVTVARDDPCPRSRHPFTAVKTARR